MMVERRILVRRRPRSAAGRVAALAALAALLAGCWWAVPGQGPDRRAHNTAESEITAASVASLRELWRADTTGAAEDPVTSNAGVHVNDGTATYGFDEHGEALWTFPVPDDFQPVGLMRQVLASGDRVLASYGYGNLGGRWTGQWVDAATGQVEAPGGPHQALRADLAAGITTGFGTSTPIATHLNVNDRADPTRSWSGRLAVVEPGARVNPPTIGEAAVYHLGTSVAPGGASEFVHGVRAFPLRDGRSDCGPSTARVFACPLWFTPLPGGGGPVVVSEDQSTLYVGTATGEVHALDAGTGAPLWSADAGAPVTGAPAVSEGRLYVGTGEGLVAYGVDR